MPFTPIHLVSPAGVSVPVGSAVEREHLLAHGYTPEPEPVKPARKPIATAPAEPEPGDAQPEPSRANPKRTSK